MFLVYRILSELFFLVSPIIILYRILKKKKTNLDLLKDMHLILNLEKKEN